MCESISYFEEAINADPNFAQAFAKLAEEQAMCGVKGKAEENVARAIELNPNLSEGYAADGFIRMFRHWDWQNAENSLRRAVALDPNSATAHHWLGVYLSLRGRLSEAKSEMKRAVEIEPNSPLYLADLGQVYYFDHSPDVAADYCRKSLALDPKFFFATQDLRDIYLKWGNETEAMKFELENLSNLGTTPETIQREREKLERGGFNAYWQSRLDYYLKAWDKNDLNLENRAVVSLEVANNYLALGDRENALKWLNEAVESSKEGQRLFYLAYIGVDPRYDSLRDDARFHDILRKMNLE